MNCYLRGSQYRLSIRAESISHPTFPEQRGEKVLCSSRCLKNSSATQNLGLGIAWIKVAFKHSHLVSRGLSKHQGDRWFEVTMDDDELKRAIEWIDIQFLLRIPMATKKLGAAPTRVADHGSCRVVGTFLQSFLSGHLLALGRIGRLSRCAKINMISMKSVSRGFR